MMMMASCRSLRRLSSSTDLRSSAAAAAPKNNKTRIMLRKASSMPLFVSSDVEMIAANHRYSKSSTLSTATTMTSSNSSNSSLGGGERTYYSTTAPVAAAAAKKKSSRRKKHRRNSSSTAVTAMKDEYGAMDDSGNTYTVPNYQLESGYVLPTAELRYQTYGSLNAAKTNVVVVCHALTGNASLHAWWGDLLGPGCAFDTSQYFVVCCNILGSCYGSTSPVSINPATPGQPYGMDFPDVSVQDTVRLQLQLLREELQVQSVKAVIGGSFGGMQALEFAVQAGATNDDDCENEPFVRSFIPIACGVQHTAWQIAVSEVQRQAIYKDPHWLAGDYAQATAGLEVARQIGMVSYRTPTGYTTKFGRRKQPISGNIKGKDLRLAEYGRHADWQVKNYLQYQGRKFLSRFDPVTYVKLTEQMDSHDVVRGRPADVLSQVHIPALVLGIDSDVLYPVAEQEELARLLPNAAMRLIHSDDGHDGFLLEQEQVARYIVEFLERHE